VDGLIICAFQLDFNSECHVVNLKLIILEDIRKGANRVRALSSAEIDGFHKISDGL